MYAFHHSNCILFAHKTKLASNPLQTKEQTQYIRIDTTGNRQHETRLLFFEKNYLLASRNWQMHPSLMCYESLQLSHRSFQRVRLNLCELLHYMSVLFISKDSMMYYHNGSPTTRKAIFFSIESRYICSASDSTV